MHQHPPSHAVSAESASTVTAPPPVSLWASRIHAQDPPQALDSLRRASASPRLRADSPVLGSERPRIRVMSSALPLEILPRAHWLSRVRSCLRLLIIVLSGAVVFMLMHTLGIYRGNRYLELRKGEIPMVWPAHTNLAPTIILLAVAAANFLASVAILSLSFKRSFRRPIRSRDLYRILAGSLGVVLWAAALAVFHLLDHASKASLRRYSCTNQGRVTNGRFQYRAVCEEQVRLPIYIYNPFHPPPH